MNQTVSCVAVYVPKDLVARIEELKQDREPDCRQSVEEIVQGLCQDYVKVRELARSEAANIERIERSYAEHPNDWDDGDPWQQNPAPEAPSETRRNMEC